MEQQDTYKFGKVEALVGKYIISEEHTLGRLTG